MTKPYTEEVFEQHGTGRPYIIRKFELDVEDDELVWHRDTMNRKVHILSGTGWKIQFDNELPKDLEIGGKYFIQKQQYHRLLKGNEPLVVRIEQ